MVTRSNFKFLCFLSLVAAVGASFSAFAEDPKEPSRIATVDIQKALQSVEPGKKAKATLEKDFNAKKKELQTEEASIRKATEEFKKQASVMNDDARAKKQAELQERIMKFQELTARSQMEISQKEKELTQPIFAELKMVIAELAKKKSYNVVLEKNENNVLYSEEKDDLTAQVIQNFDQKAKSKSKK